MFDLIGHSVIKLRRVKLGPVVAEGMPVGSWRHLTPAEISRLTGPAKKRSTKGGAKGSVKGGAKKSTGGGEPVAAGRKAARKRGGGRGPGHGARGL
jgi:hypothetical protein